MRAAGSGRRTAQQVCCLCGQIQDRLPEGAVVYAHGVDLGTGQKLGCAQEQPCRRAAGAGGAYQMARPEAQRLRLSSQFPDALNISQRAQRGGAAQGNPESPVSLLLQVQAQLPGLGVNVVIGVCIHKADPGTVEIIQHQVAPALHDAPGLEQQNSLACPAGPRRRR